MSTFAPPPPAAPAISGPSRSPYLPPATFFDRYASTIGARIGSSRFIRSLWPPAWLAEIAAQGLRHLVGVRAEDVADDLLAVAGVDLVQVDPAVQQVAE